MEAPRKTLSIREYRKLKAEEALNKNEPLLKSEEEILQGNPLPSNTFTEGEEDPSLQSTMKKVTLSHFFLSHLPRRTSQLWMILQRKEQRMILLRKYH